MMIVRNIYRIKVFKLYLAIDHEKVHNLFIFIFFTVVPCILILSSLLFYPAECTTRLF